MNASMLAARRPDHLLKGPVPSAGANESIFAASLRPQDSERSQKQQSPHCKHYTTLRRSQNWYAIRTDAAQISPAM